MNYNLNTLTGTDNKKKKSTFTNLKNLVNHLVEEKKTLIIAFLAMFVTAILNLLGPVLIGHTVDAYVQTKQYHGVLVYQWNIACNVCCGTYSRLHTD